MRKSFQVRLWGLGLIVAFSLLAELPEARAMGRGPLRGELRLAEGHPERPIVFIDKDLMKRAVIGGKAQLRLSNGRGNFVLKTEFGETIEVKVPQFRKKGSDLTRFTLRGADFGQPLDWRAEMLVRITEWEDSRRILESCQAAMESWCAARGCQGTQWAYQRFRKREENFVLAFVSPETAEEYGRFTAEPRTEKHVVGSRPVTPCVHRQFYP